MFESHRHDYDDRLAQEARQAGFSPRWIPLLVPLWALLLIGLVYFVIYEVL